MIRPTHLVLWLVFARLVGCHPATPELPADPGVLGPHPVGFVELPLYDAGRDRALNTAVWYPAAPGATGERVYYLAIMQLAALDAPEADAAGGPFPLIVFSHGSQGVGVQSPTLCEHLASHGFVVAAPNHPGNTLLDSPSDADMAQSALDRPLDLVFALEALLARNEDPADPLYGLMDAQRVGVAGHSFGGYTALVSAGASVDAEKALARCQSGLEGDIFCPFVPYWPSGAVIRRPAGAERFGACLALAAGSWGAFGPEGLAGVDMPVLLIGGTLDSFTINDLRPIYGALPAPKAMVELEGAGHMAFTDLCRLGLPVPELQALCDPAVYLDLDRGLALTNTFATAFFRHRLRGEGAYAACLKPDFAEQFPEARLIEE